MQTYAVFTSSFLSIALLPIDAVDIIVSIFFLFRVNNTFNFCLILGYK